LIDKAIISGYFALILFVFAIWVFLRDYLRTHKSVGFLSFPRRRGGLRTEDTFGFMDTVSIEVRRTIGPKNEHSQSYRCKDPIITSGDGWYRTEGLLESKTIGPIQAHFDIHTSIKNTNVTINFKLMCLADILNVEMVKAWCWLNADECSISDKQGIKTHPLLLSSIWEKVYEGILNSVRFTNKNGDLILLSRKSNVFTYDQVWKHEAHAEYVTMWTHKPEGFTLKKGTRYECTWNLRYEANQ